MIDLVNVYYLKNSWKGTTFGECAWQDGGTTTSVIPLHLPLSLRPLLRPTEKGVLPVGSWPGAWFG